MQIFGVTLVGLNATNLHRWLLTFILFVLVLAAAQILRRITAMFESRANLRVTFWTRQSINITAAVIIVVGIVSIWFDDPNRLTTALGLVTAGLAFALQRVITAIAGYIVILRGRTFNVGDRIDMGGVRGDVLDLGFIQTTIMEMGQPNSVQGGGQLSWVHSRQFTGRIVTVSNAQVFDEPVYNFTRDFPYIWEEIVVPIGYGDDRKLAEKILLDAANAHTADLTHFGEEAQRELQRRYFSKGSDTHPRVYLRMTENWVELTLRFIAHDHGVRELKDELSRAILDRFDTAGIRIASARYEIAGPPRLDPAENEEAPADSETTG